MTSSRPMSPCDIRQRARSNDGERKVGLTLVLVAAPSIKGNIVLTQIWPDGRPGGRPPTRRQGVFAGKQTVFGHELLSLPLSLLYPPVFVFVSELFLVSESVCVLQLVRTFGVIPSSYLSQLGLWKPTCREAIEIFCPRQPRQSEWKLLNRSGFEEEETFVVWNVVVHGNDLWFVCMVLNVWV